MNDVMLSRSRLARLVLTTVALVWTVTGSASALQDAPAQTLGSKSSLARFDTPAFLQPGDLLQIEVWRQTEYSGQFEITADGTIGHPLYRQIRAAGREVADIEEDLHILLTRYLGEPSFLVEGYFRVAVGGEVRAPDVYSLNAQSTIARAIAEAGGPTQRGRVDRVTLLRDGQSHVVDLTDPGARLSDLQVRSGDAIVVERRVDLFREYVAPSAAVVAAIAAVLRLVI